MKFACLCALALLALSTTACTKPDLPTALRDAKFGLDAACAIGQDTLPAVVCQDGDAVLDATRALALRDGDAAIPAVRKVLADTTAAHPDFGAYVDYLFPWLAKLAAARAGV